MRKLLRNKCKCSQGSCFEQYELDEVKHFLDMFEAKEKRDQDAILFLALQDEEKCKIMNSKTFDRGRREFYFLNRYVKRICFEALLGVSSHRVDKIGAIDLRFGRRAPTGSTTPLRSSIDAFCMVLYNTVAEPLPNKHLG